MRIRSVVIGAILLTALASAPAMASTASSPQCVPSRLNRSALLPGTGLAVAPLPDSYDASPYTQISMLGRPRARSAACA